jgi:hypothetical protein
MIIMWAPLSFVLLVVFVGNLTQNNVGLAIPFGVAAVALLAFVYLRSRRHDKA